MTFILANATRHRRRRMPEMSGHSRRAAAPLQPGGRLLPDSSRRLGPAAAPGE